MGRRNTSGMPCIVLVIIVVVVVVVGPAEVKDQGYDLQLLGLWSILGFCLSSW